MLRWKLNRALFYKTTLVVDLKERLEEQISRLKAEGESTTDISVRVRELVKIAGFLTPVCKYLLTEGCNHITYDALQIHGGAGYMKEFKIERLARDARITNIYEGTSQLQIVAATGGVVTDVLKDFFDEHMIKEYKGATVGLSAQVKEIRELFLNSLRFVNDRKDGVFQEVAARPLVEMYVSCYLGYVMLDQAEVESRKLFVAHRYILRSVSEARMHNESIKNGAFSDILHADKILV